MHRSLVTISLLLLLVGAALVEPSFAVPEHVSYQGKLLRNGQVFTGPADFKFAIVSNAGTVTLWSNDGSSTTGNEPSAAMTLPVENGVFSVRLGELASGQVPLAADFLEGALDAALRVWVNTGSGFEQLSDQLLSSTAYAQQADAAGRSLGSFFVPGDLVVVGTGEFDALRLATSPTAGHVLTSDATGLASWQPSGAGQADNDWSVSGSDMFSAVAGNVGIGTTAPTERLHVIGHGLFQMAADRSVSIATPGGWPGFIAISPNTHRRDIIFDDNGIRILAGDGAGPPAAQTGLTIRENGYLGINNFAPDATLHVNGDAWATSFQVRNSGWTDVYLGGSVTEGGILELHGPNGPSDRGISMKAEIGSGGAIMDLYDGAGMATVELNGDTGSAILGNGTQATVYFDGNTNGGGQYRAANSNGTITYQVLGQAFGSGSQMNMYDTNGQISQQWTASNREWKVTDASGTLQILSRGDGTGGEMTFYQDDGHAGVVIDGDNGGDGEIRVYDQSGSASVTIVGHDSGGNGRVITDVLEITGGADLSENFDISGDVRVEPGMVVCIDPSETGKLVQSREPYERTVAGIVSGAGGVRTGMLMGQRGSEADGEHPVALTGRVWTWCDASQGAIAPGDLLTTSNTAGHAMRVENHAQANGAILGKAMSKLESGRGLVLVLVSLQ